MGALTSSERATQEPEQGEALSTHAAQHPPSLLPRCSVTSWATGCQMWPHHWAGQTGNSPLWPSAESEDLVVPAVGAQLDDCLNLSAQCLQRMSPPLQHAGCSNVTGGGRGWGLAGSCCHQLLSSARTRGQMLGPVPGAL